MMTERFNRQRRLKAVFPLFEGDGRTLTKRVVKIPRREAILISNESRKIHQGAAHGRAAHGGRKVNVSNSRREEPPKRGRAPGSQAPEKAKHPILRALGRTLATLICLGIMVCSLAAVAAVCATRCRPRPATATCWTWTTSRLSQSSTVVATDPDTGAQVGMPPCAPPAATGSGQTWNRSPPTCSMRSSAPRTRISTTSRA